MAKIKGTHWFGGRGEHFVKTVKSRVSISATGERGAKAFYSCAAVGDRLDVSKSTRRSQRGQAAHRCAYGRNPREAIAKALVKASKVIRKRPGAFAGIK